MTISNLYPSTGPSLNLDFTNSRALDPRVTFTRTSTGTYVGADGLIRTAAIDAPRFDHDPATGKSLGLLIEEARTNYRLNSVISSSTYGSYLSKATIVAANAIAPDGTASAISIANNTGADDQYVWGYFNDIATIPTTGYLCASVFVKMISGTQIRVQGDVNNHGWIGFAGVLINFATSTPTVTLTGASGQNAIAGGVIQYSNGWWRAWFVVNTANGFNNGITRGPGVVTHIAGTSAYIWGAQIEAVNTNAHYPTSYIPTTTSIGTRGADVASITGTNFSSWYNQSEGTLFQNCISRAPIGGPGGSNAGAGMVMVNSITRATVGFFRRADSTALEIYVYTGSVSSAFWSIAFQWPQNIASKATLAYKTNDFAVSANGLTVRTDTSGTVPTVTQLDIGQVSTETYNRIGGGTFSRLTYYPTRLPDAKLQVLTAT